MDFGVRGRGEEVFMGFNNQDFIWFINEIIKERNGVVRKLVIDSQNNLVYFVLILNKKIN